VKNQIVPIPVRNLTDMTPLHEDPPDCSLSEDGRRVIYLHDDVTDRTASQTIRFLHQLDRTQGEICIHLISSGGKVEAGLAIYDAIRACGNRVTVWGTGEILSMGAVILQAAAWRVVTPNTRILFHNPYVTTEGEGGMSPKDIKRLADDLKELTARNLQIIAARSRLSTRRVQSLCNKDTRMWPREAIRLNLVDAIAEVWSEPLLSLPAEKVASSCE